MKEDKFGFSLIDYRPTIPKIYGLNIHKSQIPPWSIISVNGSALHNFTKSIAKMLFPLLDNLHIKNSGDLYQEINNLNMENKSLASFNIKSLYTNNKYIKNLEISSRKQTLPFQEIMKICTFSP